MAFVVLLAFLGLLLLYLEFFLPGSLMAIGGLILLFSSLFVFHMEQSGFRAFFFYFLLLSLLVFLVVRLAIFSLKAVKPRGTIVLQSDQEGFCAVTYSKDIIGKLGCAETDLKPSGRILIDGVRYNAISQDVYIDRGTFVRVIKTSCSGLVVEINSDVD